jgi:hypothetical protein
MIQDLSQILGKYLDGSHGMSGRAQGAVFALALSLGCFKVLRLGCAVDWFIWRQFIRPGKKLTKYGAWAAVTGATDGIGRAYCDVLAEQSVLSLSDLCWQSCSSQLT